MDKEKRALRKEKIALIKNAQTLLLKWHETQGRHDLPWRETTDPYAVLVSEFMLQQTTVATVKPRFAAWMRRFPTLSDLAMATEAHVLAEWQGLGYYSRARRLHAAARAIKDRHAGIVPRTKEELLMLPGIGEYTASAILAFAYDLPAVVLDTNIARVIARWNNLTLPVDTAVGKKALQENAAQFFDTNSSRSLASALMDLGATLCTARNPACTECPISFSCRAESPEALPRKSPRAVTTKRTEHRAWIFNHGKLFLELSQGPLWQGLWILPELREIPSGRSLAQITYPITRYRVLMKVYPVESKPDALLRGFTQKDLVTIAIPSPHRKAIEKALRAIADTGIPSHT